MATKKICFLMTISLIMSLGNPLTAMPKIPTSHNFMFNKPSISKENPTSLEQLTQQDPNSKDTTSYIFRIKYPDSIKKQPSLRAYYKGYKYDIGNMGIISDQAEVNTLFIIITDQVKHKAENERVQYLERVENVPCRAFFLSSKVNTANPDQVEWEIVEENIQNIPLRLPEDALVIMLNASMVDTLKGNSNRLVEDIKKNLEYKPSENKRTIIYLPELIIKDTINQAQLDLAAAHASLCGIDLDAMHVSPKKQIKIERERIVELAPIGQRLV